MSDRTADDVMQDALDGLENRSFGEWARDAGLGTVFLAIVYALSEAILSLGETIMAPFRALGRGLSTIIENTFIDGSNVIGAGAQRAAESFTEGAAAALGPFAFPVAVGVTILALAVFARGWNDYVGINPIDWFRN